MQDNYAFNGLEAVLPWWSDVRSCALIALQTRRPLVGLRVAIICIDLYRFDSISTSVCEQAVVLMTAGCDVEVVCNNCTGITSPLFRSRENFDPTDYDCVLYHYYVSDTLLESILGSPVRKAVFYQGITTPPETYAPYSSDFVETCREGLRHLHRLHSFDMVFSGSNYNIAQIQALATKDNRDFPLRMIPPVVSVERFWQESKPPAEVPMHILTISRIFSSKNLEGVIRFAEALVKHTGRGMRLTIAGAKCEPAYVQQLLSDTTNSPLLELDICLRASDERIREFYSQADIYACFSHHEGFCIPLVEAMAAGVPVVTHALTAIEQTMGGSGVVVDPFEYESAANQIWAIWLQAGALSSLIAEQRAVFERLYSGVTVAGQLIEGVRDLAQFQRMK